MKKLIALILVLLSFCCLFVGCTEEEKKQIIESLNFNYSDTTPMTDEDIDKALAGNLEAIQNYSSWQKAQLIANEIVDYKDETKENESISVLYRADKTNTIYYGKMAEDEEVFESYFTGEYIYYVNQTPGEKGTKEKVPAEQMAQSIQRTENMIFGNDDALFYLFKKCDAKKLNDFGVKTFVTNENDLVIFKFELTKDFITETFPDFTILAFAAGPDYFDNVTVEHFYTTYTFNINGEFIKTVQDIKVIDENGDIEIVHSELSEYTDELTINEDDFEEVKDNKD